MEVNFSIKNWRVVRDEKTQLPKITGVYDIIANGKVIASQSFNGDYGSMEIPFSAQLAQQLHTFEQDILSEIKRMIV